MVDWKTYKGEGPNWNKNFVKSLADKFYNEGNVITELGSPIWSTERRGFVPVTEQHDPCGAWNREFIPNPINPIISTAVIPVDYLAWSPNVGPEDMGRFVGTRGTGIYYTDDGGVTWQASDNSFITPVTGIIDPGTIDFDRYYGSNGIFHLAFRNSVGSPSTTAISEDGINWTVGTPLSVAGRIFQEIQWCPGANKFFATTGTGGHASHYYESSDCLSWGTPVMGLALYASYYLTMYKNVACIVASNYNHALFSFDNLNSWYVPGVGDSWYPYEFNGGQTKGQLKGGEDYLYYSLCYMGGSGFWQEFAEPYHMIRMDYGIENKIFASYDIDYSPGHIVLYRKGYGWYDLGSLSAATYDVAVGYDRAIYGQHSQVEIVSGLYAGG